MHSKKKKKKKILKPKKEPFHKITTALIYFAWHGINKGIYDISPGYLHLFSRVWSLSRLTIGVTAFNFQ